MGRNEEERLQRLEKEADKTKVETYFGNLDNINTTGVLYVGNNAINKPAAQNGYCVTLILNQDFKKQIYYTQYFGRIEGNAEFERVCNDGVWGAWVGPAELDVSKLLINSWGIHADTECFIFKDKHIVHIQLCVKEGTANNIAILPEKYRPQKLIFFPLTTNDKIASYGSVNTNGYIQCDNSLVGKLLFINFTYRI